MKAFVIGLLLMASAACGTDPGVARDVDQTAHLMLLLPDGTLVPYPTDVIFYKASACISLEGQEHVLHVVVRNTSEVAGAFVLRINGQAHPYRIGASADMALEESIPPASVLGLVLESDQTSARGAANQQTDKLTIDSTVICR